MAERMSLGELVELSNRLDNTEQDVESPPPPPLSSPNIPPADPLIAPPPPPADSKLEEPPGEMPVVGPALVPDTAPAIPPHPPNANQPKPLYAESRLPHHLQASEEEDEGEDSGSPKPHPAPRLRKWQLDVSRTAPPSEQAAPPRWRDTIAWDNVWYKVAVLIGWTGFAVLISLFALGGPQSVPNSNDTPTSNEAPKGDAIEPAPPKSVALDRGSASQPVAISPAPEPLVEYATYSQPIPSGYNLVGDPPARRSNEKPLLSRPKTVLSQRETEEAVTEARADLRRRGDDPIALEELGTALCRAGQAMEALTYFNRADELSQPNARLHHNRGVAYTMLGNYEVAALDFKMALALEPARKDSAEHLRLVEKKMRAY